MTVQENILHSTNEPRKRNAAKETRSSTKKPIVPLNKAKAAPRPPSSVLSSTSSLIILIACIISTISLFTAVQLWGRYRAHSLNDIDPTPEKPFLYENAMRHIRVLATRKKVVGSKALDDALQYVYTELSALSSIAKEHGLELEVELFRSGPGSYSVDIAKMPLLISYDNMGSVVARLRPSHLPVDTTSKSLLLAAHVDSAPGSPGANDNVVGVGVVMELLRSIASTDVYELKRPIVFFINGGEETVLTAAHSFVMQHPWATTIAAHINMESIGSGDLYYLFRLGPHSPWLIDAYAKSVSMPSTSVSANDLFDQKLIPAETDFRVFAEFGNIPGFDFVLLDNGYIYHTKYDSIEHVVPSGVRHGGQTIFELSMELAGPNDAIGKHESNPSPKTSYDRNYAAMIKLSNDLGLVKDPERPIAVFFDVMILTTITYEEGMAALLNIFVLVCTVLVWFSKFAKMGMADFKASLRMCVVLIGCMVTSFASSTFASLVYTEVYGAQMRWYGNWVNACLIYGPPALFGYISALLLLLPRRLNAQRFDHMLFAYSAFLVVLTIFLMENRAMTSYLPVFFLATANICAIQGESVHPLVRHFELLSVVAIFGTRSISTALSTTLPILGRIRSDIIPHDAIAAIIITSLACVYLLLPSLPLFCYFANGLRKLRFLFFLLSVGIAAWFVAVVSDPNQKPPQNLYSTAAPKRYTIFHTHFPQEGSDPVLTLSGMDSIKMPATRIVSQVTNEAPITESWAEMETCGKLKSTPMESYRAYSVFVTELAVYKVKSPPDLPVPEVKVVSDVEQHNGWNVTFQVEARDSHHLTVRFPVGRNSSVVDWSLDIGLKEVKGDAWIRHVGSEIFQFWLILKKTNGTTSRPAFIMAVSSCRLGYSRSMQVLRRLTFEEWESPRVASSMVIEVEL